MTSSSEPAADPLEVLAVVPARAGSKGIPQKNLRVVGGMSLVARACALARDCPSVVAVVVSSDDEAIRQEGLRGGADIAISRPEHLAGDEASAANTWVHAWEAAETELGRGFNLSVWLQPTSPTRTPADVESTIAAIQQTGAPAALTLSPVPKHFAPHKQVVIGDRSIRPVVDDWEPNTRRQDVPQSYWLNGLCYAARRERLFRDRIVIPEGSMAVVVEREVANIDDLADLATAERLLASEADVGGPA